MKTLDAEILFKSKGYYKLSGKATECVWCVSKISFNKENTTLTNYNRTNNISLRVRNI